MSKQKNTGLLVTCTKCSGEGMIKLEGVLLETLDAIKGMKRITAESLRKKMKWTGNPTAINNRLTALFDHGFLSRKRVRRIYVYTPVKF